MKTIDTFSKRIFIVAVSISLVLLSASAFLMTIQRVTANTPSQNPAYPPVVGIGAESENVYYGVHEGGGNYRLKSKPTREANTSFSSGLLR